MHGAFATVVLMRIHTAVLLIENIQTSYKRYKFLDLQHHLQKDSLFLVSQHATE